MSKEKEILELIRLNPFISQQELAQQVGLSRPAVANYIASLTRQGEIKGRAYVLREESVVVCIGGANVDRKAQSTHKVRLYSSNPVSFTESCGGVARNIAENIRRLGLQSVLLTAVGEDKEGHWLLQDAKSKDIDVSQVWRLTAERTGSYTALIDVDGEMIVSMADMDIYDRITPTLIEERWSYIASSQAIFLDTNLPQDSIEYILHRCGELGIPVFIDPVSSTKAEKLPANLGSVALILPNKEEAETLAAMQINSLEDCHTACLRIQARGVTNVIITLGAQGAYYASSDTSGHLPPFPTDIKDVTGAGDAFASTVIFALVKGEYLPVACQLGLAAAALTVQTEESVSSQLQPENIYAILKERS